MMEMRERGRWREVLSGTSIGSRFLHRLPSPLKGDRLRLRVTGSVGNPVVERFAVWRVVD